MTSAEIRHDLVDALRLDLIGPEPGSPHATEMLPLPPSRWYLAGFLVPYHAAAHQRSDDTEQEQLDQQLPKVIGDDAEAPEPASARRVFLPSSIGLSVLLPAEAESLHVTVEWGDYTRSDAGDDDTEDRRGTRAGPPWQRTARGETVTIPITSRGARPIATEVPNSGGLRLFTSVRPVPSGADLVPAGTRSVSVFLVNYRPPAPDERRDEAMAFQTRVTLQLDPPLVPRPNLRGFGAEDWDEQVADLQYRETFEYAVGHGVATHAVVAPDGTCRTVMTEWLPQAEVERVEPAPIDGVELSMEALAAAPTAAVLRDHLSGFVSNYEAWIAGQRRTLDQVRERRDIADQLLQRAGLAAQRIAAGIAALDDPQVRDAFQTANRVMAAAARRRAAQFQGKPPAQVAAPRWRPFQLAFLLMNLRGVAEPAHPDREVVDLLFFPTGGGKTEAYLGLAAFTLVLRRLRNPGIASAGVSILMRYTLRLLTLDQLSRAATLVCALELERQRDARRLGPWPFEIGLWVGQAATPNRMGRKGDSDRDSARARTIAFKNDTRKPSPIPLENCPWCGEKFKPTSFTLVPNNDHPLDLRVTCANRRCDFQGDRPLPIVAVDEPLYRRLPCFVIATVDKFAGLPWVGLSGALFGHVDRHDANGFYGPCDPQAGDRLPSPLPPPDVIIQDELHLISGPLGTIAGLYEAAIDALSTRTVAGKPLRPKIIASTATVRRAEAQIRALFGRAAVEVFPPPGPDRRDSYFALTVPSTERNARLYVGIGAQGRSLKVVLLRSYLALLAAAQKAWLAAGGAKNDQNPADPYMTLLGYFNSLRELGGSRRIVEDEVSSRVRGYGRRLRGGESTGPFADRQIAYEVVELTSREPTSKVADTKRRLALPLSARAKDKDNDPVDVALATNMISVGLDITRLGLMVVLGQPKTTAEYIQATSRVGRDDHRPGLVLALLNIHRPRDRSHYERFEAYHGSFYRAVEATSVTPFSPRAIDRALAAVVVALTRHGRASLTAPAHAAQIGSERANLDYVASVLVERAERHDASLTPRDVEELRHKLRGRVQDLLDEWCKIAEQKRQVGAGLQYQREEGGAPRLLYAPLDPELEQLSAGAKKFRANRSMRDVEPNVNLWVRQLNGIEVEAEDEA